VLRKVTCEGKNNLKQNKIKNFPLAGGPAGDLEERREATCWAQAPKKIKIKFIYLFIYFPQATSRSAAGPPAPSSERKEKKRN
jgi:hypothetical protein